MARRCALRHPHGLCTADDVFERRERHGHAPSALGAAAGNIFRGDGWVKTRLRVRSRRATNRGRELKVWRLDRGFEEGGGARAGNGNGRRPDFAVLIDEYRGRRSCRRRGSRERLRSCCRCRDVFPELLGCSQGRAWWCLECASYGGLHG